MDQKDLAQIQTLQHIHKIKLERMEIELTKEKRVLKKQQGVLEDIKKK